MADAAVLFGRRATLAFGKPGQTGKLIDGLRISFSVEKDELSTPNKSKVTVYNLARATRAAVEKTGEKNRQVMILQAGYEDSLRTLFQGDIRLATSELDGTSIKTTFESGDGEIAFQTASLDASFAAGTSVRDMFAKVIDAMGLVIPDLSIVPDEKLLHGQSLTGMAQKRLSELAKKQGLKWSIQDGAMTLLPVAAAVKGTAVLLAPDTGLIGTPKRKAVGFEFVIEATSLLNPAIKPGKIVEVQSATINGQFRCSKVTHAGDTHGGSFSSAAELKPIGVP